MALRRSALIPALAAALLAAADASATAINPQTLQCDGTYQYGGNTHHPAPSIQATLQDTVGVRIGQARMGVGDQSSTQALWRFDNTSGTHGIGYVCQTHCNPGTNCAAGTSPNCPSGAHCWEFYDRYYDMNGSTTVTLGECVYNANSCSDGATALSTMAFNSGGIYMSTNGWVAPPMSCPSTTTIGTFTYPYSAMNWTLPASNSPIVASYVGGAGTSNASGANGEITLNGSQYARVAPVLNWVFGGSYSLSAWIQTPNGAGAGSKMDVVSYYESFMDPSGAYYPYYWGIALNNGKLEMDESRDGTPQLVAPSTSPSLNDGNWHQVTVVRNDGKYRRLYADGVMLTQATAISTGPMTLLVGSTYTTIAVQAVVGAQVNYTTAGVPMANTPPAYYFNGSIDEIRVLSSALLDEDVRLEYTGSAIHKYSSDGGVKYSTVPGAFLGSPPNGSTTLVTYSTGTGTSEVINAASAPNQRWIFEEQSTQTVTSQAPTAFMVTIDASAPTVPQNLTGTGTSPTGIAWSWSAPGVFCPPPGSSSVYYQLFDAANGGPALSPPGNIGYTVSYHPTGASENSLTPNTLYARRISLTDAWGTSPLTPSASAYTLAAVPANFTAVNISTGGFTATWSVNYNPAYTRYELTYGTDPNFAVGVSTPVGIGNNFTGSSVSISGLTTGTTYYVRVRAFNGRVNDFLGNVPTSFAAMTVFTQPGAPPLSATPLDTASVQWNWSAVPNAIGFTLYDSATQSILYSGTGLTYTSASLTVNTRYDAEVEAVLPAPSSPTARGRAFTYTLANPPAGAGTATAYSSSVTYTWNANGNPSYTSYRVQISTDQGFGVVLATVSVNTPAAAATGLLPGQSYYARVQAVNGVQVPTSFIALPSAQTVPDAKITVSTAPPSPYVLSSGLAGAWQFDENSGLSAADSSGNGNGASLTCKAANCASTPTWSAGPLGLGSAVAFNGQAYGVVLTARAPLAGAGNMTVEAWVKPTAAQSSYAGIAAAGNQYAEDFALDVNGGAYRFAVAGGTATASAAAVVAGKWTHLAGVYDAAGTATLYVNGALAAQAAVPARANSGDVLAIGNRRNALGNFTLPFWGTIDSVRVFSAALSAAQVQADYQGAFNSSVTAPSPNTGIIVSVPPNAFGPVSSPAQFYISADPLNHPVLVAPAAINAGFTVLPSALNFVPNSLIEVVPVVGGNPFSGTLGSSASVSIPFTASNNIISGSNPPLAASGLRMYTLNTSVNRWEALPTTVDSSAGHATGVTPHFSVFALFAPATIGSGAAGVSAYPVPWKPGTGGRFDAAGVTFSNLPMSGRVVILTLSGQRVRELTFSGASAGSVVWDGLNDAGRRTASGVYFARIQSDADGSTNILKFAVER